MANLENRINQEIAGSEELKEAAGQLDVVSEIDDGTSSEVQMVK